MPDSLPSLRTLTQFVLKDTQMKRPTKKGQKELVDMPAYRSLSLEVFSSLKIKKKSMLVASFVLGDLTLKSLRRHLPFFSEPHIIRWYSRLYFRVTEFIVDPTITITTLR